MRTIHDHKVNGLNEAIAIEAGDPGLGGAATWYRIFIPERFTPKPGSIIPGGVALKPGVTVHYDLSFHNGPIKSPAEYNGLTNEALLAVVIDRMRGFQSGPFACRENALALTKLEEALMWLQKRTRDRMARGVEGTLNS